MKNKLLVCLNSTQGEMMKTLTTILSTLLMSPSFAIDLSYDAQDIENLLSQAPVGFEALGGITKRVYAVRRDQYLDYLAGSDIKCTNIMDREETAFDSIIDSRSARFFMWELKGHEGTFSVLLASPFRLQDLSLCHLLDPNGDSDDRKLLLNNIPLN